jgi:hypothetical protein
MSVFKVSLNNAAQGLLDRDPTTGGQSTVSKQRTVFIQGPGNIHRTLFDGDTFSDCNYYKKFCYPQVSLADAILTILSDDGSIFIEGPTAAADGSNTTLRVYNLVPVQDSVADDVPDTTATGYADGNVADIYGDTGSYAVYTQITNGGSVDLLVRINGSDSSVFTLAAGDTQVYNHGDLLISKIEFGNASGSTDGEVQIQVSVRTTVRS